MNWCRRLSHLRTPRNYGTSKIVMKAPFKIFYIELFLIYLSSQVAVFLFISLQAPTRTLILVTELANVSRTSIVMIALALV